MPTPKVLILTGDVGESLEVLYPYQGLKEEGYDVEIAAAPSKKKAVIDGEMVSARGWPDHPGWMREFIRLVRQKAPVSERETAGVR